MCSCLGGCSSYIIACPMWLDLLSRIVTGCICHPLIIDIFIFLLLFLYLFYSSFIYRRNICLISSSSPTILLSGCIILMHVINFLSFYLNVVSSCGFGPFLIVYLSHFTSYRKTNLQITVIFETSSIFVSKFIVSIEMNHLIYIF